jgi:shikimate kinase
METRSGKTSRLREPAGIKAVFLVGFMGAGKTSVGKVLAEMLGWEFEDLDRRIEGRQNQSVGQIFAAAGEAGFRAAETEALKSALLELPAEGKVMALGGGAFNSPENAAMLGEVGLITILLQAPIEELYRRCEEQALERPLRRSFEEFCKLHEQRIPAYRRATFAVETLGKPVQEVANEIIRLLGRS